MLYYIPTPKKLSLLVAFTLLYIGVRNIIDCTLTLMERHVECLAWVYVWCVNNVYMGQKKAMTPLRLPLQIFNRY